MKKKYTKKQIVEAINYWKKQLKSKKLDESSDVAKRAFEAAIAKLPKEEQDFLFNGSFSGNALAEGTDFRLTTYFTLALTPEIFQEIGYKAFDIPIYAEGTVDNVQTAVFFKKGQQDKFLADFANLCKTDKELFYGLKYGLLFIDPLDYGDWDDQIKEQFEDEPELEKLYNDSSFECLFFRVCCPRFDDEPGLASSEPLVKKVCQLAGVSPLPKSYIDKLIKLEEKVEDEESSNYEEEQRFKWDKFFSKLGIKIDPIRDILKSSYAQVISTSSIDLNKIGGDHAIEYIPVSQIPQEVKTKILDGKKKFKEALSFGFGDSYRKDQLEELKTQIDSVLGKYQWYVSTDIYIGKHANQVAMFVFCDDFPKQQYFSYFY